MRLGWGLYQGIRCNPWAAHRHRTCETSTKGDLSWLLRLMLGVSSTVTASRPRQKPVNTHEQNKNNAAEMVGPRKC